MSDVIRYLQPVLEWVWEGSVQASIMIGLIVVLLWLLGKWFSPKFAYCLWMLLIVRLILPWAPQSDFSLYNLLPSSSTATADSPGVTSEDGGVAPTYEAKSDMTGVIGESAEVSLDSEAYSASSLDALAATGDTSGAFGAVEWLLSVWLAGVAAMFAWMGLCNFLFWKRVYRRTPVTQESVLELLEDCKTQLNVHTILGVVETDQVDTPVLFGMIRPRLLLPKGTIEALDTGQLGYVFLHELAHLKRNDIMIGYLTTVLQAVHWFNPLIWYAFYRMRCDRELTCDGLALSSISEAESISYGRTIVHFLEKFSRPCRLCSTAGVLEDQSQLKRRISMIAQFSKKTYRWSIWGIVLVLVVAMTSLTNGRQAQAAPKGLKTVMPRALQKHLLAYYSFDRDGGTRTQDIAGLDFHGAVKGAEYVRKGYRNGAMRFDGKSSCVEIPDIKLSSFTFAAWAKTATDELNNRRLFLLDDGDTYFAFQGNARGGVGAYITGDIEVNEYDKEIPINEWVHLAVSFDGDEVRIYIDGEQTQKGEALFDGSITGTAYIGYGGKGQVHDGDECWDGMIDEVAIFNRALKAKDISKLYRQSAPVKGEDQENSDRKKAKTPAKLDELQNAYAEWTSKTFPSFLYKGKFEGVTAEKREHTEEEAMTILKEGKSAGKTYYISINVLGELKSKRAIKDLLAIAADRNEKDNRDRWMAVRALGLIGDDSVVGELIGLVYHYNQNTRIWAQISLVRLTGENFGYDHKAWGKWWSDKKGGAEYESEKIQWTTRYAEYADPAKQKESDGLFLKRYSDKRSGEPQMRQSSLRSRFSERSARDRDIYSLQQLSEIESLYQVANKKWRTQEARDSLKKMLGKYDKANRTGCALLYMGQMSSGREKEEYLLEAIENHGDCWYGDGVNVGAYARLHLAGYYKETGKGEDAVQLWREILEKYPNAIDHRGNLLKGMVKQLVENVKAQLIESF